MIILFLDRNVISKIKDCNKGNNVDINQINELRNIDSYNTLVSAIFCTIEGQSSKFESRDEMVKTLQKDYEAIERFFKNAKSDKQYLDVKYDLFLDTFCGEKEESWDSYVSLLSYAKSELYQPIKKTDRKTYEDHILSVAKDKGIPNGNPVLMCCLALLYGSPDASKIIKPKKNYVARPDCPEIYNVLSDLMVVFHLSKVSRIFISELGMNFEIKYYTFDKGLSGFLEKVKILESKCSNDGTIFFTTTYSEKLFPYLDENEYQDLHRNLGANM